MLCFDTAEIKCRGKKNSQNTVVTKLQHPDADAASQPRHAGYFSPAPYDTILGAPRNPEAEFKAYTNFTKAKHIQFQAPTTYLKTIPIHCETPDKAPMEVQP